LQGKQSIVQLRSGVGLSVPCCSFVVTVFNEYLVHQDPDLLAHGMTQVIRVHHALEQFSLAAALASGLLQFLAQPKNVSFERLALTAL
jgi:hypothetical protein